MAYYLSESLILQKKLRGERDNLVTLFSRQWGKVEALARGSKRILSKLNAHLEPLILSEVAWVSGRHYPQLINAQVIEPFLAIKNDWSKILAANYLREVTLQLIRSNTSEPKLYPLLLKTLQVLAETEKRKIILLLSAFILKALAFMGWRPILHRCLKCHCSLKDNSAIFSAVKGGVFCLACSKNLSAKKTFKLSHRQLKILNFYLRQILEEVLKLKISSTESKKFFFLINDYLQAQTEKEVKSFKVVQLVDKEDTLVYY